MDFETWIERVDDALLDIAGLVSDDLPDYLYADDYADGVSPKATARSALINAGW